MSMQQIELSEYSEFLRSIKDRIVRTQIRAITAVNTELIQLYWSIGKDILQKQQEQGWGAKIIEKLSRDLRASFPGMKGFSRTNLLYMRAFALAWPDDRLVQTLSGQLSWSHNVLLINKLQDQKLREWYAIKSLEQGWSLATLKHQIDTNLHQRQGKAITNFSRTLPLPHSELALGVILCKTRDAAVAEYALRDVHKPIGVSTHLTDLLTRSLPDNLKNDLPTIEELEKEAAMVPFPEDT